MKKYKRPLIYLGITLVLALVVYALSACGGSVENEQQARKDANKPVGKDMTEFSVETLSGKTVDQTIFADNDVTMVNFWGTFCGPCIQEMPDLGEINNERKGTGFGIIGVVVDAQLKDLQINEEIYEDAKEIVKTTGADYEHLLLSADIVSEMMSIYDINSIPMTFFVDSTGKVIGEPYVGSRSKADWNEIIEEVTK